MNQSIPTIAKNENLTKPDIGQNKNVVRQFVPPSAEERQAKKDSWYDAYDNVSLMALNLKVAIECAFQEQGNDQDFDCWIMTKIREEAMALNSRINEVGV